MELKARVPNYPMFQIARSRWDWNKDYSSNHVQILWCWGILKGQELESPTPMHKCICKMRYCVAWNLHLWRALIVLLWISDGDCVPSDIQLSSSMHFTKRYDNNLMQQQSSGRRVHLECEFWRNEKSGGGSIPWILGGLWMTDSDCWGFVVVRIQLVPKSSKKNKKKKPSRSEFRVRRNLFRFG